MAGTVTTTEETQHTVHKILFDWTSSAGGAADATTSNTYDGVVGRVVFVPDGGGTQPSANYDVVVNDADSVDILDAGGGDLSNTATEQLGNILGGVSVVSNSKLTLGVTNAGSAKGGKVIIYIR